jgi:hypothetical protein
VSALVIAASAADTIVKLGAYAGFASIIGLAVMSLLYFAQAREVKRLREWAGRAPERDAEVAQRVQADAQKRVVATPMAPATTAAQQAEAARTAAAAALYAKIPAPAPPPAPLVGPPGQLARPVVPGTLPGQVAGATTTPAPGSVPGATTPSPVTPPAQAPGSVPGALTAAAAASATGTPSAVANGSGGQDTHESDAARPDPLEGPLPLETFEDIDDGGFTPGRMGAIIGGAVGAVIVAIVLMVALTGEDTPSKPNELGVVTTPPAASPPSDAGTSNTTTSPAAVDRRGTRVAVLNGTTQTGLARAVADQVEKARFTIAATATNADQAVPTTTVSYRAGNQRAAAIVAQVIGVGSESVQPVDANATAAADADVVVIVGADKIG